MSKSDGKAPSVSRSRSFGSRASPNCMTVPSGDPWGIRTTVDSLRPSTYTGTATTRPASGPATAMSNSDRRSRIAPRSRMTAPSVPKKNGGGTGMKYGRETGIPCRRPRV